MSTSPEILDLLKNVPLFSGLSSELLTRHIDLSRRIILAPGHILLSPGDPFKDIYVILSGRMSLSPGSADNEPVAMFGAGDSAGEMSALNGSKALAYLIADTECELLCVDLAAIWSLMNDSHQAARNMLNVLSKPIPNSKSSDHKTENRQGYAGLNNVDEMTGLYNSQWMLHTFGRQVQRCAITHDHATLMLVSINQFKPYNQSHGRLGGDQALRTIAQTILTCLRPNDQAARYQGNIFAVFMPHTILEEGHKAEQRLLLQASQATITTPGGDALPSVTISTGLTEVHAEKTLQQLLDQATEALQRAKQSGCNCINS